MIETKDIIIYLAGFVSSLIITFASHVFVKIRDTKSNFLKAATDFSKPFLEAKVLLDLNNTGLDTLDAHDVFNLLFTEQKRAIIHFIPIIPKRHRHRIRTTWDAYENAIKKEDINSWFSGRNFKNTQHVADKRIYYLKAIEHILYFSDYHNNYSIFNKGNLVPTRRSRRDGDKAATP